MRKRRRVPVLMLGGVVLAAGLVAGLRSTAGTDAGPFRPEHGAAPAPAPMTQAGGPKRPQMSGALELGRSGQLPPDPVVSGRPTEGAVGARVTQGVNIRVSRDNTTFAKNETSVAVNPTNPRNIVVGQNDYRIGIGQSGFSAATGTTPGYDFRNADGTDADGLIPMVNTGFGEAWDGGGDPAVDFNAAGRVYYTGLYFNRTIGTPYVDCRNGIYASWSDNGGLTWSRPSLTTGAGIVVAVTNAADCTRSHDKEYVAVDRYSVTKNGNVYVTWTLFDSTNPVCGGYCQSPILFSQSTDNGVSFSTPIEINGINAAICSFGNFYNPGLNAGACNFNQFSVPAVGSDGTIYVVYYNTNTAAQNQYLMVKCLPAADCSLPASWSAPVKIGDVFDINLPFNTDGRQTLSNSNFRIGQITGNIVIDRGQTPNRLYAFWTDNRNGGPSATGNGATGGTDLDVFVSRSTDGGATWTSAAKVNQDTSRNDQFHPWAAVQPVTATPRLVAQLGALCVSYFDRRNYANNQQNDVYASCSTDGGVTWTDQKLNDTPQNLAQLGGFPHPSGSRFVGDYTGNAAIPDGTFIAVWTDTRHSTVAVNKSDIYASVYSPVGQPAVPPRTGAGGSPAVCSVRCE